MIYRVPNVPLVPQGSTGVCWYASAAMLAQWSGGGKMVHPKDHTDCKQMHDRNSSFPDDGARFLIDWLKMRPANVPTIDVSGWQGLLSVCGPVWAAGKKYWNGEAYGHVVVVCGVADTGLYIHDPEPINQGRGEWRTWASMHKYFNDGPSIQKLLVKPV